jgi:hypothetical protein
MQQWKLFSIRTESCLPLLPQEWVCGDENTRNRQRCEFDSQQF